MKTRLGSRNVVRPAISAALVVTAAVGITCATGVFNSTSVEVEARTAVLPHQDAWGTAAQLGTWLDSAGTATANLASYSLAPSVAYFDRLGVGLEASFRGESLRVKGKAIFGQAGPEGGLVSLMPPDGSGFIYLEHIGNHRLRLYLPHPSGDTDLVTLAPGKATFYGDIDVRGRILQQGRELQSQLGALSRRIEHLSVSRYPEEDSESSAESPGDGIGMRQMQII